MAPKYEICAGLDKGHKTTPNELKKRPSKNKGKQTNHNKFVRDLIREVAGFSPYEKVTLWIIAHWAKKNPKEVQFREL